MQRKLEVVTTVKGLVEHDSLLFGLALDKEYNEQAIITIYRK